MTMRYAHLSKEFAKEEIQIMNALMTGQNKKATFEAVASPFRGHCHKTVTSSVSATAPLS
jgi:hypothetical protein